MQKLIKLSDEHYIVVDDSEIKEGWKGFAYKHDVKGKVFKHFYTTNNWYKDARAITHSTQPLGFLQEKGITTANLKHDWGNVKPLSLSEVKELIGEVDVEKKADEFCDRYFTEKGKLISVAYKSGYTQALEDNKENVIIFICKYLRVEKDSIIYNKIIKDWEQSLQPKTEWEVEFIDGKLKLK